MSCYQNARRSGELNLYPTNAVIDSPLEFIEMMINHYPGDVLEHLRDLGYEITKPPE